MLRTAEIGGSRQGDSYSASERARLWVQATTAGSGGGRWGRQRHVREELKINT